MPSDDNGVLTPSNNVSPGLPATTSSSPILSTPSRSAVPPTGDSSPVSRTTGDASLVSPTNNIAPIPSPVLLTASDSSLVSRTAADASLFSTTNTVAAKPGPVSTPSTNDNPGLPTPNHDHLISSTAAEASSLPPTIAVAPAPNFIPSTSSDNTPVSGSTAQSFASAKSPSHRAKITHSIIAGIVGLVGIVCVAALANLAYQISIAKKAGKPGSFPNKSHKFIFVIPPYMPDLRRNKRPNSYQITLTLTPVDIQDDYTYQQVAWQRFNINDGSDQFTATLQYDRAFGAANIRNSVDSINRVSWCDPPVSFGHAKPGRPVYLRQSTWKALNFIRWKYQRIIARNEDRVPVRMVIGNDVSLLYLCACYQNNSAIGSYICHEEGGGEPTEISQHVADDNVEEAIEIDALVPKPNEDAGFQSFVVLDETIDYAEQISASFDLILRAYKTQDVEVGQILPWNYLRDKAVPLLGEQGIRLSKLPKVATWSILSDGSDMELIMERPALRSRILDNVHRLSPF
ncbi:hypothetical protein B0H11DRAFT_2121028 [Mycena galericulata]|nr:hypothetical protein B0H11DRAFT_2121028 [Mycena galericulata]